MVGEKAEGPPEAQPLDDDGAGFSTFVTRWWPWGRRDAEGVVATLPEGGPAEGHGDETGTTSGDRFWLGFRWFPSGEREPAAEEGGGDLVPLSIGEVGEVDEEVPQSRWVQLRSVWGFGRDASSAEAVVEEVEADALLETEEDEEQASLPEAGVEDESLPVSRADRPWLSLGWTPWGPVRKPDGNSSAVEAPVKQGIDAGGPVIGEGEGTAVEQGKEDDALPSPIVAPVSEDVSYLRRWWPGSLAREAAPAVGNVTRDGVELEGGQATGMGVSVAVLGEGDETQERGEDGTRDGELIAYTMTEEQSLLRRWWHVAKAPTFSSAVEPSGVQAGVDDDGAEDTVDKEIVLSVSQQQEGETQAVDVKQEEVEPSPTPTESPVGSRLWPIFTGTALARPGSGTAPDAQDGPASSDEAEHVSDQDVADIEVTMAEGFVLPEQEEGPSAGAGDAPSSRGREEGQPGELEGTRATEDTTQNMNPPRLRADEKLDGETSDGICDSEGSGNQSERDVDTSSGDMLERGNGVGTQAASASNNSSTANSPECAKVEGVAVEIDDNKKRPDDDNAGGSSGISARDRSPAVNEGTADTADRDSNG